MKLLLLRCPHCAQALAPGQRDVVMMCPNCHSAVLIQEGGLELVQGHFAAPKKSDYTHWVPVWIYQGQVKLLKRETQGRSWRPANQAKNFWAEPRRLYIPAWEIEIREAADLTQELIGRQPFFREIPRPDDAVFEPVILTTEDIFKLLDLVVVTIEAERSDDMESLDFDLTVNSQELWFLPAVKHNEDWQLKAEEIKP